MDILIVLLMRNWVICGLCGCVVWCYDFESVFMGVGVKDVYSLFGVDEFFCCRDIVDWL